MRKSASSPPSHWGATTSREKKRGNQSQKREREEQKLPCASSIKRKDQNRLRPGKKKKGRLPNDSVLRTKGRREKKESLNRDLGRREERKKKRKKSNGTGLQWGGKKANALLSFYKENDHYIASQTPSTH